MARAVKTSPKGDLLHYETRMEQAETEVHTCLRAIKEGSLYKDAGYKSFELYCKQRWGYSKSHAYRLIDYGKVVELLKAEGVEVIPTEGQARPVLEGKVHAIKTKQVKSEAEFLQKAANTLKIAIDTSEKEFDVPKTTRSHVEATKERFGGGPAKPKIPVEVKEVKDALTKFLGSRAYSQGGGDAFKDKYGDVLGKAELVHQWLTEYLETG